MMRWNFGPLTPAMQTMLLDVANNNPKWFYPGSTIHALAARGFLEWRPDTKDYVITEKGTALAEYLKRVHQAIGAVEYTGPDFF